MRHHFVGLLGGGVQAHGMINPFVRVERHLCVHAIHGAAGSIYQMLHLVVSAPFQNIQKSDNIGINVGLGIFNGITNASLSSQIDNMSELLRLEEIAHGLIILKIDVHMLEQRAFLQNGKTCLFEVDVVIVVEVVESHDFMPFRNQAAGQMKTNEAGCAGNKNLHKIYVSFFVLPPELGSSVFIISSGTGITVADLLSAAISRMV